jgi:CBS domain containing-hemolysin-like protein
MTAVSRAKERAQMPGCRDKDIDVTYANGRIPADDDVEDVLAAMQRSGAHLARVVTDSGSVLGAVFLEDVLEELVGEVRDESQRRVG